jgi:hypothetical protein
MIIDGFFSEISASQGAVSAGRSSRVREHLRRYIATHGESILMSPDLVILDAEREFDPVGAIERISRADDLLFLLPAFISAANLLPDRLDARAQLKLSRALIAWMTGLYDPENQCTLLEFESRFRQSYRLVKNSQPHGR